MVCIFINTYIAIMDDRRQNVVSGHVICVIKLNAYSQELRMIINLKVLLHNYNYTHVGGKGSWLVSSNTHSHHRP